ncbi:HAD family hydrolase [Halobacterium jilantaiense]|uniref:HAD family hydrolase n=1 Tax=Halobacterium jilantaiense TaxID=355548 RepID=UPI000B7C87C3|nr:HAD family hydrolase [Halobacterium jilantaiense]
MTTSFDCFGTLVDAQRPEEPASAVADALADRGVRVPEDWTAAYREPHAEVARGAEYPLPDHVAAALASRGVDADAETVREATVEAFDRPVQRREGALAAVEAARERGPVAVLSNCSVPGLVERALTGADLAGEFDAVVVSVDCGWRKPDERAFRAVAGALDTDPEDLVHVGDDPEADGGVEAVGGHAILLTETDLREVPGELEGFA